MTRYRNRKSENTVYLCVWLIVAALYLLDSVIGRVCSGLPPFGLRLVRDFLLTFTPFLLCFFISNWLISRLLLKNRYRAYLLAVTGLVALMWMLQYLEHGAFRIPSDAERPLPMFLDFIYSILIIGVNVAIALVFQRYSDRLSAESRKKTCAVNELQYLKTQINPHFYMNMLNSIHGMIEIDPERAQSMVIDMSRLMRYMIYDSSRELIPLSEEIAFLEDYLRIMRRRFPDDKVRILSSFPDESQMADRQIPPLLFLVFVENAFKHGISYRERSAVEVSMSLDDDRLVFGCFNTVHPERRESAGGLGLQNIRQRLALLYGDSAALEIRHTDTTYYVTLIIPLSE